MLVPEQSFRRASRFSVATRSRTQTQEPDTRTPSLILVPGLFNWRNRSRAGFSGGAQAIQALEVGSHPGEYALGDVLTMLGLLQ